MADGERYLNLVSPKGKAMWAFLSKPQQPFDKDSGKEPKYKIHVVFDLNDQDVRAMSKAIEEFHGSQGKQRVFVVDKQAGTLTLKASSVSKPTVVDASKSPMDPKILVGNDSIVRVAFACGRYKGFGGGTLAFLNAVQVIELNEYKPEGNGAAAASAFNVETGYTSSGSAIDASNEIPF